MMTSVYGPDFLAALGATGGSDRRERRAPRGSSEDDPRGVVRRDLVRPLRGRAIRLRQPIRRPLDHLPGEQGRADRFGIHGGRARRPRSRSPRSPPPLRTTNRPSTRRCRRLNPTGRLAMSSRLHKCKRRYRRTWINPHRLSHRRHRSPSRPRPRRSASGATARSSEWTSRNPAADGAVDAEQDWTSCR